MCSKSILLLVFIFLMAASNVLQAQDNREDSLLNVFEQAAGTDQIDAAFELFEYHKSENPDIALDFLDKGKTIARELHSLSGEAKILRALGTYYNDSRQADSSEYYFNQANLLYEEDNNQKEQFNTLLNWSRTENLKGRFKQAHDLAIRALEVASDIGRGEPLIRAYQQQASIFLDQGEFRNSIESLIQARRILDTLVTPAPVNKGMVLVGIGRTEVLRGHSEDGLPYLKEGLKLFEEQKEIRWQAITLIELGSAYFFLEDYDSALTYYQQSLDLSHEMNRDDFVAANLGNIAAIYLENKEYDEALRRLFEAREIHDRPGSVNNLIIVYNDIASAYVGKESYDEAIDYYSRSIHLADSIGSLDNLNDALVERAETYEMMGSFEAALKDYKRSQMLKDSLFNESKARQIEELKTAYETEKKEQQIALLEQEALSNRLQRLLLGTGLVLSIVIIGLILYSRSQKAKRNQLEKENLQAQLEFKKRELTTHALNLARKNEVLDGLKQKAIELKDSENSKRGFSQLIRTIEFDLQDDKNWENFNRYFEQIHVDFNSKVKNQYPDITANDLRLLALLKMNLSSKEIATILNISQAGIKKARHRLRKKLQMSTDESLQDTVIKL